MFHDPLTEKARKDGYDIGFVHGVLSAFAALCILWTITVSANYLIG